MFKIPAEITGILIMFVLALLLLAIFLSIGKFNARLTNKYSKYMPIHNSILNINLEQRVVEIIEISKNRYGEVYTYPIDEFIYMLSINSESKEFRELLKLINNNATTKKIKEKLLTVNKSFMCLITFAERNKSLTMININPEQEFEDVITSQLHSSQIAYFKRKKQALETDFIQGKYLPREDSEIYSEIIKQSKKFLSKGVTIIKISPKYNFVDSNKDYFQLIIQANLIKETLQRNNINFNLGRDGSLYAVVANDRKRNAMSVQRAWTFKIESMLPKPKHKEYIDIDIDAYNIQTYKTSARDSNSINEALIFVNLTSEIKRDGSDFNFGAVTLEANSINETGALIVKAIKDNKLEVKTAEFEIIERGIKSIQEIYIDYPSEVIDAIIKYSFKHKRILLEGLLNACNKVANKSKDKMFMVNIEITNIPEINKYLSTTKLKPNLHLAFVERENINHFHLQITNSIDLIKEKKIKTIQYVLDESGPFVNMYRHTKSEYILIAKGLTEAATLSDMFKINLKNLENIKEKTTKIINIK